MDLKDKTLEEWLEKQKKDKFPMRGKIEMYKAMKIYLNSDIHPYATAFASIKDGSYLTDHGPGHIKKVILKASELVDHEAFILTPYEVYLLLVAIHFHDIGHIEAGRYQHEINARKVMQNVGNILGNDNTEKTYICDIAEAHGGSIAGDKDKISLLTETDSSNNQNIRPQLLAAILRFADELSDDRERAAEYLMKQKKLPPSSEIFHRYAYALHSVKIDHMRKTVKMCFELDRENVSQKYRKDGEEIFLLDEIYKRTLKTYCECLYCMRFISPLFPVIQVSSINVEIKFLDEKLKEFREKIFYRLADTGYPDSSKMDIFSMCPDLKIDGCDLNGDKLKELVEKKDNEEK